MFKSTISLNPLLLCDLILIFNKRKKRKKRDFFLFTPPPTKIPTPKTPTKKKEQRNNNKNRLDKWLGIFLIKYDYSFSLVFPVWFPYELIVLSIMFMIHPPSLMFFKFNLLFWFPSPLPLCFKFWFF